MTTDEMTTRRLMHDVAGADGYLSLALHRPGEWQSVVREQWHEIEHAVTTLRTHVPSALNDLERFREGVTVDAATFEALAQEWSLRPTGDVAIDRLLRLLIGSATKGGPHDH